MPGKRAVRTDSALELQGGVDTEGRSFDSITQLWREELEPASTSTTTASAALAATLAVANDSSDSSDLSPTAAKKRKWYDVGAEYWQTQPATYDGVLGGFGRLSPVDIRDSRLFLSSLPHLSLPNPQLAAIDCGAGVGRIAADLLCPLFGRVDLVEQDHTYVRTARQTITHASMRDMYACGLQDFDFARPPPPLTLATPATPSATAALQYDVVWVQWVLSQLTDSDLHAFLLRCRSALVPARSSYLLVKENTAKAGFVMDRQDGSVTRSDALFKEAFERAGWRLLRQAVQTNFPKALFTVRMWALQPIEGWQPTEERKQEEEKAL